MNQYSGPLYLPPKDAEFKLTQSYVSRIKSNSNTRGFTFDNKSVESFYGLKLFKRGNALTDDAMYSEFIIPVDAQFKIKYQKRYGGGQSILLMFTTTLNKHGPCRGGFIVANPLIPLMIERTK